MIVAPRSWTGSGQSSGRAWRNASGGSREGNLPLLVRIAVISTMDGPDWGGSEELWAAMAHEALTAGDDVFVSVNRWTHKPHQLSKLEAAGAIVETRSRARQRLVYRSSPPVFLPVSFRSLQRFRPDVVCLSHGATLGRGSGPRALLESDARLRGWTAAVCSRVPVQHRLRAADRRGPAAESGVLRGSRGSGVCRRGESSRGRTPPGLADAPRGGCPESGHGRTDRAAVAR